MLITSRTPLRISFFGGGTDYPEYFHRHRGAVLGMAINRYIYISAVPLSQFVGYHYRISYSRLETVNDIASIEHPVVRAVFAAHGVDEKLDLNIMSDVPASTGMGSSSAFTVGLINLVARLKGETLTKLDLAKHAIHVERDLLKERVGVQDQLHAAYGGINRFDFEGDRIRISPLQMTASCQRRLIDSMVLVFTNQVRHASATLDEQIRRTVSQENDHGLGELLALTDEAVMILEQTCPDTMLAELGRLLDEGWRIKRKLSSRISNGCIDTLYERCKANGALGGKLLGAGGGGFVLAIVPPELQPKFFDAMEDVKVARVDLDPHGSVIIQS